MIYAIGDIHGLHDPVKIVAEYLYDRIKQGEKITKVIFLGDLIDCGPSSREVVDIILSLRQDFDTVTLLGNHEEMLLSFYSKEFNHINIGNMWLNYNGGIDTIRSFYPDSVLFNKTNFPNEKSVSDSLMYDNVLKLDAKYVKFFENLDVSCSITIERNGEPFELVFSHSVPSLRFPLDEQMAIKSYQDLHNFMDNKGCELDETIIWNRQLLNQQLKDNLIVIHGHTPTRYYRQLTRLVKFWEDEENAPFVLRAKKTRKVTQIDIDTGLVYGGSLTMLAINDSPDTESLFPYYLSIDPRRGFRHRLYTRKEIDLR